MQTRYTFVVCSNVIVGCDGELNTTLNALLSTASPTWLRDRCLLPPKQRNSNGFSNQVRAFMSSFECKSANEMISAFGTEKLS